MKKTLNILIIGVASVVVFCSAAYFGVYGTTSPCEAALDALVHTDNGSNASFETREGAKNILRSIGFYADKTPLECLIELTRINYEKLS
jgi:hypothetical protein